MTDEIIEDIIEDQEAEQPEIAETTEPEEKPHKTGWLSKEEWEAEGKDPNLWVSEEVHKERGLRIAETNKLRREFEKRLESVGKFHQIQMEKMRNDLMIQRDNAIDVADRKEVHRIDKELRRLETEVEPVPTEKPPEIADWESENPWIFNADDPRTAPATKAFAEAQANGKSLALCIAAAERAAAKAEMQIKRTPMAMADVSKSRGTSKDPVKLSMRDITSEEKAFRMFYSSDAEFLQMIADERRSRK